MSPIPLLGGVLDRIAARRRAARPRLFELARRFWYSIRHWWWTVYFRLDVRGLEHVPREGPVLLCGNHVSHLDAPAILAALPRDLALRVSTAAAKDVFGERKGRILVSKLTTNALPIERGAEFSRGLRALEQVLLERRPLMLFPEGMRSDDGELVEFKSGAAMLAYRTGAPIVPIWLEGVRKALPKGAKLPTAADVTVCFGKPIDPAAYQRDVEAGKMNKREAYQRMTDDLKHAIEALRPNA